MAIHMVVHVISFWQERGEWDLGDCWNRDWYLDLHLTITLIWSEKNYRTYPIGRGKGRPSFVEENIEYNQCQGCSIIYSQSLNAAKPPVICYKEPGREYDHSRHSGTNSFEHQKNVTECC